MCVIILVVVRFHDHFSSNAFVLFYFKRIYSRFANRLHFPLKNTQSLLSRRSLRNASWCLGLKCAKQCPAVKWLRIIWALFDYCLMMFKAAIISFSCIFRHGLLVSARQHPLFRSSKSQRNHSAAMISSWMSTWWGCAMYCTAVKAHGLAVILLLLFKLFLVHKFWLEGIWVDSINTFQNTAT